MLDRALGALAAAVPARCPRRCRRMRCGRWSGPRPATPRACAVPGGITAQDGYEDDGQGSARMWLRRQTRVTKAAAAGSVGWMRRLAAHPVIAAALTGGEISASWARAICGWSERLPEDMRGDADQILAAAAAGGAELADLAGLAQQMAERALARVPPTPMRTDLTTGGWCWTARSREQAVGTGDLTPSCAAAVSAVLEALAKLAGPEDLRTVTQRRHDALEEACRRLIVAEDRARPGRAADPGPGAHHAGPATQSPRRLRSRGRMAGSRRGARVWLETVRPGG